jgi:hypothetical protein
MAMSVRQLLDQARTFHHRMGEMCESMSRGTDPERVRLLLNYLSQHELKLEQSLQDYEKERSHNVLDHWLDFTPCESLDTFFEEHALKPGMPLSDIIRTVLQFDDCLIGFYRQVAEETVSEEVRNLFTHLVDQEESDKRKTARGAAELE